MGDVVRVPVEMWGARSRVDEAAKAFTAAIDTMLANARKVEGGYVLRPEDVAAVEAALAALDAAKAGVRGG